MIDVINEIKGKRLLKLAEQLDDELSDLEWEDDSDMWDYLKKAEIHMSGVIASIKCYLEGDYRKKLSKMTKEELIEEIIGLLKIYSSNRIY